MVERGILFTTSMVQAKLAGRKRMTRRAVNPQPPALARDAGVIYCSDRNPKGPHGQWHWLDDTDIEYASWIGDPFRCRYGVPGDRLYVKETFYAWGCWERRYSEKKHRDEWHFIDHTREYRHAYLYDADFPDFLTHALGKRRSHLGPMRWWKRPAIFMPKAAARIFLDIVDIRIEQLLKISEADAIAEGIEYNDGAPDHTDASYELNTNCWHNYLTDDDFDLSPIESYLSLYAAINGDDARRANPWVFVITFQDAEPSNGS